MMWTSTRRQLPEISENKAQLRHLAEEAQRLRAELAQQISQCEEALATAKALQLEISALQRRSS
jgi:phage host-nuclease inhibitor protein Gam